jgi:hypothetical protein
MRAGDPGQSLRGPDGLGMTHKGKRPYVAPEFDRGPEPLG